MRKFLSRAFVVAGMLAMAACGGGGDSKFETPGTSGGTPTPTGPVVASISVLASTPTMGSASATPLDISAYAKDANNALVKGASVTFGASSGQLAITQATTDDNGLAKATLAPGGDPSNRTITVTATSGTVSGTVAVNVTGTQLSVQGPSAMVLSQAAQFTVRLIDSAGAGISGQAVTIASARSNTLSATSVTTDASGNATFNLTIANPGSDTLTLKGLNITTTAAIAVNSDAFSFTTPSANTEIPLNTPRTITVRWLTGGSPVVGQPVSFAATRGTVSAPSVNTDSTGSASITVTSTNSGGAAITASGSGGATAQLPVEFVATTAATVEVQPSLFTMSPGQQSTLTATVRDSNNNLVKNKVVTFSLQDVTGGSLTTASAVTDSQGRAQSTYTAGATTSAADGVVATATVQGTAISDVVNLTVAQAQLFIAIGTGNLLETPTSTQYSIPYVVQVTDANGNGVANVPIALKVLSTGYIKGQRNLTTYATPAGPICPDEDTNHNGVLDLNLNEDDNGSGRIEAGNIATVTADKPTTDASGFANIHIIYPREYAYWLWTQLDVRAAVTGTEFVRSATILLPGTKDDFDGPGDAPGMTSPFGVTGCGTPN